MKGERTTTGWRITGEDQWVEFSTIFHNGKWHFVMTSNMGPARGATFSSKEEAELLAKTAFDKTMSLIAKSVVVGDEILVKTKDLTKELGL